MDFKFEIWASVERTQGKFASRDEIEGELIEALESANPGSISASEGGEYEVGDWEVVAIEIKKKRR